MTKYHNQLTGADLLTKHALYVRKHKLTGRTKYDNAAKPAGYYACALSIFQRFGKDLVCKTFGWKVNPVPPATPPSDLASNEIAILPRWAKWYSRLPRKESFTVTDVMRCWWGQRQSNASMYLRRMAEVGLLRRGEPAAEVNTGRPKFLYHRNGKWQFRSFNRHWSIASKR